MSYKEMLIDPQYCGIYLMPLYTKYFTNPEPHAVEVAWGVHAMAIGWGQHVVCEWGGCSRG